MDRGKLFTGTLIVRGRFIRYAVVLPLTPSGAGLPGPSSNDAKVDQGVTV